MNELKGNAAITGGVSNILTLMRQRDEACRDVRRLQARNVELVKRMKYLLERLHEAEVKLGEAGELPDRLTE